MSIAGGVDNAVDRARAVGATALQIFLKNNNRWKGKPLDPESADRFRREIEKGDLGVPIAHASYLINLASSDRSLVAKSLDNLADDIERADRLGVAGIVLHPGAHKGDGLGTGIRRIGANLNKLFSRTSSNRAAIYLENTAGQGTSIGFAFEHLRDILDLVQNRDRMGVCLDTCHLFAAGYDIRTKAAYDQTVGEFDRIVGLEWLRALHLNDSKREFGSRRDRHEHIGKGYIGRAGFAALMQDQRLCRLPHVLETPKGEEMEYDRKNLALLRRLAQP